MFKNERAKGQCYATAMEMLLNANTESVKLCHGIATQTQPPFARMGHAWVEWELSNGSIVFCIDGLFPGATIPRDRYYSIGNIDPADVVRYSLSEAKRLRRKHRTPGPWDEKIAAAAHADEAGELSRRR